jgi:hypothetical protein
LFLLLNFAVWLSVALIDDLPVLPTEDNPIGAVVNRSQAGASVVSKSRTISVLPGFSFRELNLFVEYVPRPVP